MDPIITFMKTQGNVLNVIDFYDFMIYYNVLLQFQTYFYPDAVFKRNILI